MISAIDTGMKIKYVKPTEEEKRQYMSQVPKPTYPLYRWAINVPGTVDKIAVEDLSCWPEGDPQVEAMMPRGFVSAENPVHSILGDNLQDLASFLQFGIIKCSGDGCCDNDSPQVGS